MSILLKYPSSHLVYGILLAVSMTCLIFTCTTDEHSATKGHSSSSAGMDSHRQRLNERSLLKCDIIRQPEQFLKRETRKEFMHVSQQTDEAASRLMAILEKHRYL